jgi:hypothetical protein
VAQILVAVARNVQKRGAVLSWDLNSLSEDSYLMACIVIHGIVIRSGRHEYKNQ